MTSDGPPVEPLPSVQQVQVPLAGDSESPGFARTRASTGLEGWRLSQLIEPVKLVVSDLVTNAVRYGRPPIFLVLRRRDEDRVVELDVHDANPEPPRRGEADNETESGRGLAIVETLVDTVDVEQVPDDGKIVRARFRTTD